MASITKVANGYRAQVYVKGQRDSKCFRTRREADAWGAARETALHAQNEASPVGRHTFGELLRKFRDEVSPHRRGARWEELRIEAKLKDPRLPANMLLADMTSDILGAWRNERLKQVAASTVLRELKLLSSIFEHARLEWKWIESNPVKDVRKPRSPDHRETLIAWQNIRRMLAEMGYRRGICRSVAQAVAHAFLFALRTGMRAGEICGLTWDRVFDDHCTVSGKTRAAKRSVPLTAPTKRLLEAMRGYDPVLVFGMKSQSLDANFRKYRNRAGLEGFTFHDSRHTAATRIAKSGRIDVLTLCKIFGWSNPSMAMIYYNPTAKDVVNMLKGKGLTA
jgi:integrase